MLVNGTLRHQGGQCARQRAAEGDEPVLVDDHLDGRGQEFLVDHALDDVQQLAVTHLGHLAVGVDDQ